MHATHRNARYYTKRILIILIVVFIVGYSVYQSRNFRKGPVITITTPSNGATIDHSAITISGTAENISHLSLNGRPIFIDQKGAWSEQLLLLPGYNIIHVDADDRFGKKVERKLELIYTDR